MSKPWNLIKRTQRAYPVRQVCEVPSCQRIGQRHHQNRDRADNRPENVTYLCQHHHAMEHILMGDWGTMKGPKQS